MSARRTDAQRLAPVEHTVDKSIERFREGFRALSINERDVKVTWDSEARFARLRMLIAPGVLVEKVERCAGTEPVEAPLWRLTQYLHAGKKRFRAGESLRAVFGADAKAV